MQKNFFEKWTAFEACSLTGSLSQAAQELGEDASLLSRRIQSLEDELGVKLLKRSRQGSSLTEAGSRLLEVMSPIIQEFEDLEAGLTNIRENSLHLYAPDSIASSLLTELVQKLATKKIKLCIHASKRYDVLPKRPHEYSLYYGAEPPNADVVAMRLGTVSSIVAASPEYLEKNGDPENISDLNFHRILFGPDVPQNEAIFVNTRDSEPFKPEDAYEYPSCAALLAATASGAGVAVGLPKYVAHELLQSGQLIELPTSNKLPVQTVWLLRLPQRFPNPTAQLFIKEIKNLWLESDKLK